jgi:hypothetical protein
VSAPSEPDGAPLIHRALAAIDHANGRDPNQTDGGPRAQVQGGRATEWLHRVDPDAGDALRLAVRAHHLRRWSIPRGDYPDGRPGYLRWRRDLKAVHARAVAEVLAPVGIDEPTVARVQQLVQKEGLGTDPEVQTFEDVVCLVFLETQFDDLADRLADPKMIDVLRKTVAKLSPAAVACAGAMPLSDHGRALLLRALGPMGADPAAG